jgi:mono/diheme cytochrome c family protein
MTTGFMHPRFAMLGLFIATCVFGSSAQLASARQGNPSSANNPNWNYEEIKKAPEKARLMRNPFENDSDALRAGGKLFERNCAGCHGMKGEGRKKAPSLIRDEVQQATPGALFWVLTNGVVWHGMPVWSKLPEPQRWQIVMFLKSLGVSTRP